jgi:hypothetical protein
MPMVTPTLNIPQPSASSTKAATAAATPPAAAPTPAAKAADVPSTTVTLSPQAMSAAYAASHPSSAAPSVPTPAQPEHDGSVYESLKSGIATAVTDVGDAIAGGAHAVVDGVETTLSTANKVAKGILELPFAAVAKGCDTVGSLIDEL